MQYITCCTPIYLYISILWERQLRTPLRTQAVWEADILLLQQILCCQTGLGLVPENLNPNLISGRAVGSNMSPWHWSAVWNPQKGSEWQPNVLSAPASEGQWVQHLPCWDLPAYSCTTFCSSRGHKNSLKDQVATQMAASMDIEANCFSAGSVGMLAMLLDCQGLRPSVIMPKLANTRSVLCVTISAAWQIWFQWIKWHWFMEWLSYQTIFALYGIKQLAIQLL